MVEEVEQITVIPEQENKKEKAAKDPKKVAAGKALARKNAEARKQNKEKDDASPMTFNDVNYGIQAAAGFVGAGFVLYHGFKFFYPEYNMTVVGARQNSDASLSSDASVSTPPLKVKKSKQSKMIEMD